MLIKHRQLQTGASRHDFGVGRFAGDKSKAIVLCS